MKSRIVLTALLTAMFLWIGGASVLAAPVHRFYNYRQGVHFYTIDQAEATNVNDNLWHTFRYEGVGFDADANYVSPKIPVHRFYNYVQGVHFFTANQTEATYVNDHLGYLYRYEGIAFYAYQPSVGYGTAVYRFYNLKTGVHFYTANFAESQGLLALPPGLFRFEGMVFKGN